jgi:DNA-binding transcriptional LysR family regulator
MDPQQLSAFIAVAETGSFTRAANRLHLTQPAISKRIYLLEGYLGNSLFDRIGKRVNLTEAGRVLLPHAHKILRDIEDTSIALQNLSDSVSGRLILASSHHVGLHRLPPILKQFSAQFPDVLMDISFLDSEKAYKRVVHGDLELAVVTLSISQVDKIVSRPVWRDELCVMSSKEHPLSAYNRISLEDLLNFPAILPGQDTFTRLLIEDVFLSADLKLEVEMSTNYLETIKMMVSVGMAWSILPKTMCDDTLKILKIKGLKLERELGTIVHSEHTLSNAAEAFISVLEQHSTL